MFGRKRKLDDFSSEIEAHLALEIERLQEEQGLAYDEARATAYRVFGNVTKTQERFYESGRWLWLDHLWQDMRFAVRMLRKSPGFTTVAVLTLALGIGANTAIFALIDAVALRPLPVPNPHQLVLFEWKARHIPRKVDVFARISSCPVDAPGTSALTAGCSVSYPMFEQIRAARDVLSDAFCFGPGMITLSINDHIDQVGGMYVSGDFFPTLGSHAALGRTLQPSDDVLGAAPVVVLSYDFWQSELGADASVVGKPALIDGHPFRVVGIAAPNFPKLDPGLPEDFWIPLASRTVASAEAQERDDPRAVTLEVIGRLKPGVSTARAETELNAIFVRSAANGPTRIFQRADEPRAMLASAAEGLASLRRRYSKSLLILLAATGLVLLLASCNVAGLLLARSSTRQKEIAVRTALGAGRWRILRQLLTESLLLALAGGGLGLVVAEAGATALAASITASWFFPIQFEVGIDSRVLIFLLVVSTIVGLLFGHSPEPFSGGGIRWGRFWTIRLAGPSTLKCRWSVWSRTANTKTFEVRAARRFSSLTSSGRPASSYAPQVMRWHLSLWFATP
ncbi:MAG TPA: ABC transporter permease [Candidatus Acidoferrum sp.]|nr:ABC transporter permease [Candidatus Acidoferrum sp.]